MLIGLIRPVEKHSITLEGEDIAEVREQRRDAFREIEAAAMTALEAQVPEGWQMLSVRTA